MSEGLAEGLKTTPSCSAASLDTFVDSGGVDVVSVTVRRRRFVGISSSVLGDGSDERTDCLQ